MRKNKPLRQILTTASAEIPRFCLGTKVACDDSEDKNIRRLYVLSHKTR